MKTTFDEAQYFDLEKYLGKIKTNKYLPLPQRDLQLVAGGQDNFIEIGVDIVRSLIKDAGLHPHQRVLEIGCGVGRVAIPLTQWIEPPGEYWGLDVVSKAIDWCKENISTHYENFRFHHIDVFNEYYNPSGRLKLKNLDFSFLGPEFQVVFLSSVFTHLVEKDALFYLDLAKSLLSQGGILWCTWFVVDQETRRSIESGKTSLKFDLQQGPDFYLSEGPSSSLKRMLPFQKKKSTAAVAYEMAFVADQLERREFDVLTCSRGTWCERRSEYGGYQDLIVARRRC